MNPCKMIAIAAFASSIPFSVFAGPGGDPCCMPYETNGLRVYEQAKIVAADCNVGRVSFQTTGATEVAYIDAKHCQAAVELLKTTPSQGELRATVIISTERKLSNLTAQPTVLDIGEYKINVLDVKSN